MGQTKGIIYNFVIIVLVAVLWYFVTRKESFQVKNFNELQEDGISELNLELRRVELVFVFNSEINELDTSVYKAIENIRNQFSYLLDLELDVQSVIGNDMCCDKCSENLDQFRLILKPIIIENRRIVDVISIVYSDNECNSPIPLENVHYVNRENHAVEIPRILMHSLRTSLGLPDVDRLYNGLTKSEIENAHEISKKYFITKINKEIRLFNALLDLNKPYVTFNDHQDIINLQEKLQSVLQLQDYNQISQQITQLNSRESLYKEEYFQWDFKVGVYAPIFIPSLFPLSAAIYSKVFMDPKNKIKTE